MTRLEQMLNRMPFAPTCLAGSTTINTRHGAYTVTAWSLGEPADFHHVYASTNARAVRRAKKELDEYAAAAKALTGA